MLGQADGEIMWVDQGKSEVHHLTCMVCGALPGTTCIDSDYQELAPGAPVAEDEHRRAELAVAAGVGAARAG